jgi:hypothetical protein
MSELPPDAMALARAGADPAAALNGGALDEAALAGVAGGDGTGLDAPGADAERGDAASSGPERSGAGIGGLAGLDEELAQDGPGGDAGVLAERERLARQLREARMQLAMTQARLTALQNSATMALGKTLVRAAKRPWPRGVQLPRDLYRMWRERGEPGKTGGATLATALAAAQLSDLKGTGGRFLASLTAPGSLSLSDPALAGAGRAAEPPRLVITGALTPLGCATLAPDAVVHPLLPHDADILIEGTGADLVVIEAAALLAAAPWAHATDPAGADRGRRLARMIVMARSLGKPVVLVRNVAPALLPGLGWVAAACDAVWDGGLGVQLARFNPVGVSPARPVAPLYAGDRDPREAPAVRALLDELTAAGGPVRVTGARCWQDLPELYRRNGVFVTGSPGQALEQRACGARVIGPLGGGASAASAGAEIAAARARTPLAAGDVRAAMREIFEQHATPAALARLAARLDLPGAPAGAGALIGGRRVSVLAATPAASGGLAAGDGADFSGAAQARLLADGLLRQRLRPAEVIVAATPAEAPAVREALGGLRAAGIGIRVADLPAPGAGLPSGGASVLVALDGLARLACSPWVAPLDLAALAGDAPLPGEHLLDLACARECAQADAVAHGGADWQFAQRIGWPALARRDLFLPGAPALDTWGSRGLRLFTISSQTGAH